jgi:hypothetical protein
MRTLIVSAATLAAGVATLSASAAGPDYPVFGAFMSKATSPTKVAVSCSALAPSGRDRVHCTFRQTFVQLPNVAEIEKGIAETEALVRARPAEVLKSLCGPLPANQAKIQAASKEWDAQPDGPDKTAAQTDITVCRTGNVTQWLQDSTALERQVGEHQCEIFQTTWEGTFERVDANTWVSTVGPEGSCHVSHVDTLWREAGDNLLWSYRQVNTQPEVPDPKGDKFCAVTAGTHVEDFSWRNNRTRDLGCRYLKM